ncbi:MAG: GIY-YIG nuclease family protein [Phycisphaerales bacterium]|nr:GIY-YIG nuclease family protein [Phycisphaerales bacterium]
MTYWVYVLFSEAADRRYIGQTDDLNRRVDEHNDPSHNSMKFTSKHPGPWVLVHSEQFETRSEAMRREKRLKSGQGRAWLDSKGIGRASPPKAD